MLISTEVGRPWMTGTRESWVGLAPMLMHGLSALPAWSRVASLKPRLSSAVEAGHSVHGFELQSMYFEAGGWPLSYLARMDTRNAARHPTLLCMLGDLAPISLSLT